MLFFSSCGKLKGEGGNVIYTPDVGDFTGMDIDIPCTIIIVYADTLEFTVEAQQNILDNMYFEVVSNKLYVELDQKVYDHNPMTLTFKMPDFRSLSIHDVSDVNIESGIHTKARMRFEVSGDATINANDTISCYELMYDCTGTSTLNMEYLICDNSFVISSRGNTKTSITGESPNSNIEVEGMLEHNGYSFSTLNTEITVSGVAEPVFVNVSNRLDVNVSGDATVRYKGNPTTINVIDTLGRLDISAVE